MLSKPSPTLSIDLEFYQNYLDDSDLTDEQKKELLETLWSVVCEFVMLGFNVHPVQQVQESCAKNSLPPAEGDSPTVKTWQAGELARAFIASRDTKEPEGDNPC